MCVLNTLGSNQGSSKQMSSCVSTSRSKDRFTSTQNTVKSKQAMAKHGKTIPITNHHSTGPKSSLNWTKSSLNWTKSMHRSRPSANRHLFASMKTTKDTGNHIGNTQKHVKSMSWCDLNAKINIQTNKKRDRERRTNACFIITVCINVIKNLYI